MALTRNYEAPIFGKTRRKDRLKKAKKAKEALTKLVLQDKVVQEMINKKVSKIKAAQTKSWAYIPYKQGLASNQFYNTREWIEARYKTLVKYGKVCQCCGASNVVLHVDHIKPRSKYPHLELDIDNLQVLCEACNVGKGNKDVTDWR